MANKVHVEKFIKLLGKATLNWSIPHVRLTFTEEDVKTSMKGSNAIVKVNGRNDVITNISPTDEWEINFQDVVKNIKSYLSIIQPDEDGYANIQMKDEKIIIKHGKQRTQCYFCTPAMPPVFTKETVRDAGEEVVNYEIDEEFVNAFSLIKKVAGGFNKIYFGVENGHLFMEAGDRTNPHSNNMLIKLKEVDYEDFFVCFDFKSFNDVMILLGNDAGSFKFRLGHLVQRKSGLISVDNEDNELYYLLSLRENIT